MEKFNRIIIKFLLYYTPVVVIEMILAFAYHYNSGNPTFPIENFFMEAAGIGTVVWFVLLIYIFFAIAFNEQMKNTVVRKLAGIKEDDEREQYITGVVSKNTFISMTGILVLLLFLSAIRVSLYKVSDAEVAQGKHGVIQFGLGLSIKPEVIPPPTPEEASRNYIIKYGGLPLGADGTLILVMVLQIGAFYYFSRKQKNV